MNAGVWFANAPNWMPRQRRRPSGAVVEESPYLGPSFSFATNTETPAGLPLHRTPGAYKRVSQIACRTMPFRCHNR